MTTIPLFKVFMSDDVIKPLNEVLLSGMITQGKQVDKFEDNLCKYFDHKYILTLNSATSGLTLALRLLKDELKLSDETEILTTPLTCMATNLPILANNMKLKWVDTDRRNCNIDLDDLESKITESTKIIMFVHWGGNPVDMNKLTEIINRAEKKYGFRPCIIEDCAHSFGMEYNGKKVPNLNDTLTNNIYKISVFSLQAIKHLTTGDGGLIILPNEKIYEKAKLLRWYGIDRDKRNYNKKDLRMENDVTDWGYKYHMNDINATIGIYNLPHIDKLLKINRENGKYYDDNLSNLNNVKLLENNISGVSAYWLYTIYVKNRDEFIAFMNSRGIMCSQVHKRNDVHSCFSEFKIKLSKLDDVEKTMVCIPVGWWITHEDREKIVNYIKEYNII